MSQKAKVITVFSEKGGVGKTTLTTNLSVSFAKRGYKVLVIDMDPQGHVGKLFGVEPIKQNILIFLIKGEISDSIIKKTRVQNLWVVPSDWSLADFTVNVARDPARHLKLRKAIDNLKDKFDIIFIDPPPSLELITLNILLASDGVIIPVALTYLGLAGVAATLNIIIQTKKSFKYSPGIIAIVPNMYDDSPYSKELLEKLKSSLGKAVSKAVISKDPEIDKAQSFSATVIEISPDSQSTKNIEKLTDEIILKLGL